MPKYNPGKARRSDDLRRYSVLNAGRAEQLTTAQNGVRRPAQRSKSVKQTFVNDVIYGDAKHIDTSQLAAFSGLVGYIATVRDYGHHGADLDPLGLRDRSASEISPDSFELVPELLNMPASVLGKLHNKLFSKMSGMTVGDALNRLNDEYCMTIGYEFGHLNNYAERQWLYKAVESGRYTKPLTTHQKEFNYRLLLRAEIFESFLHRAYPGQRWFSLEGTEIAVPLASRIVRAAAQGGIKRVFIGMAHRGRLNFLTHILDKSYEDVMYEFTEFNPKYMTTLENAGWMMDVKYHLGAEHTKDIDHDGTPDVVVQLLPNPSHLELVNPVVMGAVRAYQDLEVENGRDTDSVMGFLIHGDLSFAGQGIVTETLNFGELEGYGTRGTIHLIINNQIGFTTTHEQGFSGKHASDVARGYDIPIVHVNADDTEACLSVAQMAVEYRRKFHKDFVIDLVGYRRYGHNENDEPAFTQPLMYRRIRSHPSVLTQFATQLTEDGVLEEGQFERDKQDFMQELMDTKDAVEQDRDEEVEIPDVDLGAVKLKLASLSTADIKFDAQKLGWINRKLTTFPDGFTPHKIVRRVIGKRDSGYKRKSGIDWGHAEALALGTLLHEGINIRLTGQDVERGTFSQRHAVVTDSQNEQKWVPLTGVGKGNMYIHNSPLCELGAVGFEYGYSVADKNALVLWEAQFGDFVNGAQSMIDEMLVSGRAKWGQNSSVVLLLPHGYEGQGPNHSSAHLERFLTLAARDNIRIICPTTAAQLFCALRSYAKINQDCTTPMIVITGKSLLRHSLASASASDLSDGRFKSLIRNEWRDVDPQNVHRLVLCAGKVFYDLVTSEHVRSEKDVTVVRLEELYPFPTKAIKTELDRLVNLTSVVWLQEEPRNRGGWTYASRYLEPLLKAGVRLGYVGRPPTSAPAEGTSWLHKLEQKELMAQVFSQGGD